MKLFIKIILLAIALFFQPLLNQAIKAATVDPGLITYNAPTGADQNKDFTIQVDTML